MIILILLGGIGQRFKKENFKLPKALIKVNDKEILYHLIDNLNMNNDISYIYIPYNKEYVKYNIDDKLIKRYPNYKFKFLILEKNTEGAAETIYLALKRISTYDKPILCLDSDSFYTFDIIKKWNGKNCIFSFISKTDQAKYSYVTLNEENIIDIVEKNKISDNACCGAYGFESYYTLMKYCKEIINANIKQKGEFYTSGVIKEMIKNDIPFINTNVKNKDFFSLGTPEQVKYFEYSFLFDLDGTLVNTDNIYIKVWNELLKKYQIDCTEDFFHSFIKGKSDISFLKYLINNISNKELKNISKRKDELFIKELEGKNIIYNGVYNFFDKIQNSKIAIVTNCNKKAASFILDKYGLTNYVNILIASEDVNTHKPSPESYLKAMTLLNVSNDKCLIFEDSDSGYLSAKKSQCFKICLYDNGNNLDIIKKHDDITFSNYNKLELVNLIKNNCNENIRILTFIKNTLKYLPVKDVEQGKNNNLKTGYICDIDRYIVYYLDNSQENIIIKLSNLENELSKTAKKLNMYENEVYFYSKISKILTCIDIPKFYGCFMYDNRDGIIMEDLYKYDGNFNVDLNNNITILLNVVEKIFNMHNKYYFEGEHQIIECMKVLKKPNEILYYKELVNSRFETFYKKNKYILTSNDKELVRKIYTNYEQTLNNVSNYPLSFCHGDLKSPNIFYKTGKEPYFLDWQYIQLNKGVSDIVFLLVESINFDSKISDLILNYYFRLLKEKHPNICYDNYMEDIKHSLCIFPFFVMIWFNSEDNDKLIDKCFPLRFMKNLLKYYNYYLV